MRTPIVAGNWKMNGSLASVAELAKTLGDSSSVSSKLDVIVFPPFIYLPLVQNLLQKSKICWGAQNLAMFLEGAYTGEISASMLKEFNCTYVIVGHSERRQLFAEDDITVAKKTFIAVQSGLTPIICLGESLQEREKGETKTVIARQLQAVLQHVGVDALQNAIFAYEPIWAIGTGLAATPQEAQEVHGFIRELLAANNSTLSEKVRIIYGGSVKAANAKELFAMRDIDGALVGGASLNAKEFLEICLCYN